MNKKIKSLLYSLIFCALVILPSLALAQTEDTNTLKGRLDAVAGQGGFETGTKAASVPTIIGMVINVALGFLGVIFLGLMIMAGYNWMTANGNEEIVKKAKGTIKQVIIGLIVVISAWSIWGFIFTNLINSK